MGEVARRQTEYPEDDGQPDVHGHCQELQEVVGGVFTIEHGVLRNAQSPGESNQQESPKSVGA
jgi:hypothetical protein